MEYAVCGTEMGCWYRPCAMCGTERGVWRHQSVGTCSSLVGSPLCAYARARRSPVLTTCARR
eukprot:2810152-Rhodomonas_salina.2